MGHNFSISDWMCRRSLTVEHTFLASLDVAAYSLACANSFLSSCIAENLRLSSLLLKGRRRCRRIMSDLSPNSVNKSSSTKLSSTRDLDIRSSSFFLRPALRCFIQSPLVLVLARIALAMEISSPVISANRAARTGSFCRSDKLTSPAMLSPETTSRQGSSSAVLMNSRMLASAPTRNCSERLKWWDRTRSSSLTP